jgi:hypothetical protein
VPFDDRRRCRANLLLVAHVAGQELDTVERLVRRPARTRDDRGSGGGEHPADARPDTSDATGHERHSPAELQVHAC